MSRLLDGRHHAVLFDLDGTLIDTAPDMVAVLQDLQREHGHAPVAYELGRSYVSKGARGLLRIGFPDVEDDRRDRLQQKYLERYADRICERSAVFSDLDGLLDRLDAGSRPWGVVTNKPTRLTEPLLEALALAGRSACTVSGDTLKQRKPDPAPLLHACDVAGLTPQRTIYVGDAAGDIEAGRGAGMTTIAVAYGYITHGDDPAHWGADMIAASTADLAQMVLEAVNLGPG